MFKFPHLTIVERENSYLLVALFFQSTTINFNYVKNKTNVNKYDSIHNSKLNYSTN